MKKGENLHAGHRKRVKERVLKGGLDDMAAHQVLEYILFFSIGRADTNEIAHRLLRRFNTLDGVFEADVEDLKSVEGIGPESALLLSSIPAITRRYMLSRVLTPGRIMDTEALCGLFKPFFIGRNEEHVYLMGLDSRRSTIGCQLIHVGSVNAVQISIAKIVTEALRMKATFVILAHNHPGGAAVPSDEDINTTYKIRDALLNVGIRLLDHLVVANPTSAGEIEGDVVSLADSGYITLRR